MTLRTNVSYHQISKRPTLSYLLSNFSHSYIKLLHNWILFLQANIFMELHSIGLLQIWNVWETGISDNLDWTKESEVKRAEMWLCWKRQGLLLPLWAGTTSSPLPSSPLLPSLTPSLHLSSFSKSFYLSPPSSLTSLCHLSPTSPPLSLSFCHISLMLTSAFWDPGRGTESVYLIHRSSVCVLARGPVVAATSKLKPESLHSLQLPYKSR